MAFGFSSYQLSDTQCSGMKVRVWGFVLQAFILGLIFFTGSENECPMFDTVTDMNMAYRWNVEDTLKTTWTLYVPTFTHIMFITVSMAKSNPKGKTPAFLGGGNVTHI